jgi:hypothetical protein
MSAAVVLAYAEPGRVLLVNSPVFGLVSVSLTWAEENGSFRRCEQQPAPTLVPVPGMRGYFRERRWGTALAVSLPDGVHVLDSGVVGLALHHSGADLNRGCAADDLAAALVAGLAAVWVARLRELEAAAHRSSLEVQAGRRSPRSWQDAHRRLWGSTKRYDSAVFAKVALFDAVRHGGLVAA